MKVNYTVKLFGLVISLLLLGIGIYSLIFRRLPNECEMTYMYGYPQFIELHLHKDIQKEFPVYRLLVYGEDNHADRMQKNPFSGIPVLFIPGSAGSYKQVRSLASVALRKYVDSRMPFHFDFFTTDLNEELSALQGSVLVRQAAFVKHCIPYILSLYSHMRYPPKSVVLIGHSMGGMIAKGIFSFTDFNPQTVSTIVTLATPHRSPVLNLDKDILNFYEQVRSDWQLDRKKTEHVMLVSIGGGASDWHVRSELTLVSPPAISALTTSIPGVQLTTDHLCMAWCKQLVLVIVRSLFDMVDTKTYQITEDSEIKRSVVNYHVLNKCAGKRWVRPNYDIIRFQRNASWREVTKFKFVVEPKDHTSVHVTYSLENSSKDTLIAVASQTGNKECIYGCFRFGVHHSVKLHCEEGRSLRDFAEYLPGYSKHQKVVRLNLLLLKERGFLGLVFVLPNTAKESSKIEVDIFSTHERTSILSGNLFTHLLGRESSSALFASNEKGFASILQIPFLQFSHQAYKFSVTSASCKEPLVAEFSVPWSIAKDVQVIHPNNVIAQSLFLHTSKPSHSHEEDSVSVFLVANPECRYDVKVVVDYFADAKQSLILYGPLVPGFVAAILLETLGYQIESFDVKGFVPSFVTCFPAISVVKLVFLPCTIGFILSFLHSSSKHLFVGIPLTDYELGNLQGLSGAVVCVLLYFVSLGIVLVVQLCLELLVTLSTILEKFGKRLGIAVYVVWLFSCVLAKLQTYRTATLFVMLAISFGTCGSVGLLLGILLGILQLCVVQREQIEAFLFVKDDDQVDSNVQDFKRLSFTVMSLWLTVLMTGLPTLIHWVKNEGYVPSDPVLLPVLVFWVCHPLMWYPFPADKSRFSSSSRFVLGLAAIACVLFATVALYRIPWIVATSTAVVQLITKLSHYARQ